ncbi:MAG: hypothetical protein CMM01_12160 [Rhodopirellula sp.]|nr:hypothetical protein [Rhodopirellula sp.]OUX50968.1 MAG: hypothetical protein CBE43_04895 [Rhodopirellula sp. TMED283]
MMAGLPRRDVLRGLGVAIALPSFASLRAESEKSSEETTKRFVCVSPNYGMNPGGFFPTKTGRDYKMPSLLESLQSHRDSMSLFTNLDHPGVGGGHGCSNTFLNGVEMKSTKENPQRLLSLDQLLAEHLGQNTRFPSMLLGSGGFSWSRAGIRLPTQSDPVRVFTNLFVDDAAKAKQQTRQFLHEDTSILDVVRKDARSLRVRLAQADQQKLDQYFTSIREVERKLNRQAEWIDVRKPTIKDDVIRGRDDDDTIVDLQYPYNTSVMYDLMVLALQTNSTNVICFGHPGGNRLFPFDGITLGYHSLTHHGKRPELLQELSIIERFYANQFATFLSKLKDTKDSTGRPLLDSTAVLFGSGMGNASSHSSRNLPVLLAGGGFQHGKHHRFERQSRNGRPLGDLFVSILQQFGIDQEQFSNNSSNLNHLLT